ncbi:MAG: serine/threonine protein kinase [Planctomycetaceae bacterium]|nr:serine/threonine protein kinase [Planctomycetaceae bacterium]
MKPVNVCLSKSEILALLSSDLPPDETVSAEQHIADCETCRAMIESMIGDSRWWNDAQQSLAALFMRNRPEADVSHEAEPTTSEQMLSLLGPTDDPDKIGRIAEYEVIGIIGRGGMGVVFKAFDPRLNRFVAIKMLLPHLAASGAARKRFAREGQAAAAVVDDFVLPIYAVAEWKGVPYLVTQFSRGTTLQKRVQSEGPLEVKEILRLGIQTSRGLAAAHAQGLVHRDVKPSNILLDGNVDRAMLTDFGLARAADDASITRTGVIAGTPQYMSPEQARGQCVDARSDLFSLGCVLYFLCTGHPPFRADNSYAVLRLITDEEPRSIREINPDIPAWLCSIVQKLMAKNAEVRYGSAMDVAELLEACLAHVQQPTIVPLPASLQAPSRLDRIVSVGRFRGVVLMISMLTMVMCGMIIWQSSAPPDISGGWTSSEWGTVILKSESPGSYRGTIEDAVHTLGANPHSEGDPVTAQLQLKNVNWSRVQCTMCHQGKSGTIQLKWSRVERRFNGTWQMQDQKATGRLSVQPDGTEIHGAWTTQKNSDVIEGTPRLADLVWKRSTENSPAGIDSQPFQSMIESLPNDSATDGTCTSTIPPDITRILLELEKHRGLKRDSVYRIHQEHKDRFRIIVAPVYDKLVPVRDYPVIGRASLHLLRYECTVKFSPTEGVDWPLKKDGKPEYETTFFVDSDHLHRETQEADLSATGVTPRIEVRVDTSTPPSKRDALATIKAMNSEPSETFGLEEVKGGVHIANTQRGDDLLMTRAPTIVHSTLAEAVRVFNEQSASDRRTLFNPPIPQMTEEQLRDGLKQMAREYRNEAIESSTKTSRRQVAEILERIAETRQICTDNSIGLVLTEAFRMSKVDGKLEFKQIAANLVFNGEDTTIVFPVRPFLELIYNRCGKSSQAYGELVADSKPVELSELQGQWRLVMKPKRGDDSEAILSIESNRASVNPKDDLTADMRFVMHLDSQGEPQPIDLEFVLGVTELAQLQELTDFNGESNTKAIDFYPLRDGKPVALGIIERTEKGFRICMEHAKSVGRPVAFEVAETAGIWELEALSGVRSPTVGVGND